jgi:hypothetical protein
MIAKLKTFIRAVSRHWLGKSGVVITNAAFFTLIFLELLRISGILTNSYSGLVTYMTLPALFIFGLLLIPMGWWRLKKGSGLDNAGLMKREFDAEFLKAKSTGSNLTMTITVLTLINLIFFGTISARMLHFMDKPVFCGTACHVMEPEWTTYQASPHAHVACVSCHVGEGVGALIDSKINGLYQVLSVSLNLYEKPIPTPVHQLRPARETCEKCHWPEKFYGMRLKTITHFQNDSLNSPKYTTLALKVGAAESEPGSGIHWHISRGHEVIYKSLGEKRERMAWAEVHYANGEIRRFENSNLPEKAEESDYEIRTMDCVDCHNRATHIYENMEYAIDRRMAQELIPNKLPYIKNVAMAALSNEYPDKSQGIETISRYVNNVYRRDYPQLAIAHAADIDKAADAVSSIYQRNIFPAMEIGWDAYKPHIGHQYEDAGCFRCHNEDMQDSEGNSIDYDCTLCHSILAWDEDAPFAYVNEPDSAKANFAMHSYLKAEFVKSKPGR